MLNHIQAHIFEGIKVPQDWLKVHKKSICAKCHKLMAANRLKNHKCPEYSHPAFCSVPSSQDEILTDGDLVWPSIDEVMNL